MTKEIKVFLREFDKLNEIEKIGLLYSIGATDEDMKFQTDDPVDIVLLATNLFKTLTERQRGNVIEIMEVANGTETTEEPATDSRQ